MNWDPFVGFYMGVSICCGGYLMGAVYGKGWSSKFGPASYPVAFLVGFICWPYAFALSVMDGFKTCFRALKEKT